ncbi:TPA: zinc-ribbon domain-containing protein [Streptococcus equi subsp. zooepidemicus]|uniref:zinc-ribbon domain-containing protein n=1 Tax=Streptococcus equi TaxID=1336 RepID=UPI000F6B4F16|nr:zinc-ribbon domain-containing protein [Streptococcus equi]VED85576.1 Predicted membrane protein [Streptococcus equi subsp. equi]MCD3400948.1 zinc-ribbon domain-containing protein [Streptococcus equi subsp. zooepidemicus]MCD3413493.1 zinc-ribbon domain-containing protein [Streptococcus equi subsp. zooepidemicus]MCD3430969.1 zinc-ribbon domain-containing protein [Streptococcus equi subsp. zooepidemicus]QGM23532.1 zinc-ribbon domain-containing protein [Streptococcus equi subsp. zooepidemicus]
MYCSKCGKQNGEGSKFCMSCGNALQTQNATHVKQTENVSNINTQPKLGQTPDFYTYVCVALNIVVLFVGRNSPTTACLVSIFATLAGFIGIKRTTNRNLHFIVLVISLIILGSSLLAFSVSG